MYSDTFFHWLHHKGYLKPEWPHNIKLLIRWISIIRSCCDSFRFRISVNATEINVCFPAGSRRSPRRLLFQNGLTVTPLPWAGPGLRITRPHNSNSPPPWFRHKTHKQIDPLSRFGGRLASQLTSMAVLPVELWCVCRWICSRSTAAPATSSPRSLPPAAPPWTNRFCRPSLLRPWLADDSRKVLSINLNKRCGARRY